MVCILTALDAEPTLGAGLQGRRRPTAVGNSRAQAVRRERYRKEPMLRIGIDTGGTFTDFVVNEDGKVTTFKLPSTPDKPEKAVLDGMTRILESNGEAKSFLVRYGSTVATNTLLERKGAKTALVTNQGFEDILEIGRQNRPELYRLSASKPEPLVPSKLRVGIKERTLHDGSSLTALEGKSLDWLGGKIGQIEPESLAVVLLYSYLTPESENRIAQALSETGIPISLSHRVHPEFREYERTCATVINAYLTPTMTRYLSALTSDPIMEDGKLTVMQSSGGAISGEVARSEPIRTLLSGPAGGVVGAFRTSLEAGFEKIISFDMGGTSTDVCLCDGGISTTNESMIDNLPVPTQMIGIHTIGAGGGSLARIDSGGLLRVGPESAGADPGPVAYGKGDQITVTDAHIFLGHLHPDFFLGGEMQLFPERIEPALEALTQQLNQATERSLSLEDVAEGILDIVNTQMENAIRVISLQKGFDTRDFALVSFGGSGGLHACHLAKALMIPRVLVPSDPGLLSAAGILAADIVKDTSRTVLLNSGSAETDGELQSIFQELDAQVQGLLSKEGFSGDSLEVHRSLDLRYPGQAYELNVPYSDDYPASFHRLHEQHYGYSNPGLDLEIVTLRVRGTGLSPAPETPRLPIDSEYPLPEALMHEKQMLVGGRTVPTKIFSRQWLRSGNRISGPAVVAEYSSTTLIPEGFEARVDEWLNLVIQERP